MAVNRAEFEVDLGVRGRRQVRGAARDIDKLNASLRRGNKVSGVGAMRDQLRMQRRMQDRARFQQKGGAGSVFGGLFAFEALKGASRAMMSLTKAIGGAVIGSAAFAQSQEMAFRQLSKHGVDGGRLFEHARATAQDFGLDVKNTTKQYAKFLALQFSPREADKLVAMGADLQALGNDAESVKGIFTALGQIKSKDRLQAEELLQLSERGISTKLVQEEIGKLLGKTQDEVRKLQEQGKVDAETALLGIERAVNRKLGQSQLGETGKKFAQQTLEGIAGRFKANWDNLWIGLGQRTDNRMTEAANKLLGKFENWVVSGEAARFMDDTALAIGRVADGIETATDLIDPFSKGLKRGSDSADGIATFLDGVANKKEDFKDLSNDAEKFGRALGFAWEAGGSLLSLGGRITAELTEPFTGLADSFLNSWERIGNMINGDTWGWESKVENIGRELIRGIGRGMFDATMVFLMPTAWPTVRDQLLGAVDSMREGMFNRGGDLMKGLGEGILRGVGFPVDAVKSAAQGIIGAAKETLGIRSPSRVFAGIGYQTQAGFALGVQRSSRLSVGAATVAGSRVSAGFAMGLGRPDVRSPTLEGKPPAAFGVRSALRPVEMPSALPMGMGSGGLHLHGPLVHVEASGTVDEGALIEAAEAKLEPMLESILARWSGELGAG